METLFLCGVGTQTMIMCETHAKVFEKTMLVANLPHTIIELEDEDIDGRVCMACHLDDELTRPRIILPN